jgi:hypothetical protein
MFSCQELFRYNIPEQCRLDLTEADIKFAKSLLEKASLSTPPNQIRKQLICANVYKKIALQFHLTPLTYSGLCETSQRMGGRVEHHA